MKITNKNNLPEVLVKIAEADLRKPKLDRISVTELGNSIKETVLYRRRYDELVEDVSEKVAALFGTAFHNLMEVNDNDDGIEGRVEFTFENGITLSGRYDKLDGSFLIDYKTTTAAFYMRQDFSDYRRQGLSYAWLLWKKGIYVSKLKFYMFLKDWQLLRAEVDENYPNGQVMVWEYDVRSSDLQEIENYIVSRINEYKKYIDVPDNELPEPTPEELWYSGTKYAVMKHGGKRALRVFDDEEEANIYLLNSGGDFVEKRYGENIKLKYSSIARQLLGNDL